MAGTSLKPCHFLWRLSIPRIRKFQPIMSPKGSKGHTNIRGRDCSAGYTSHKNIPVMVGLSLIPPLLGGKILLVVRSKFGHVVNRQCLDKLGTVHEYPLSLWFQLRATSLFIGFLFMITQAKKV